MKIRELVRQGFPAEILSIWEQTESEDLLPVQSLAISKGLLEGRSMVIAAPTSAGKTFLAEIAAYRAAQRRSKVIYVAPHKAIVEEKYEDLRSKYRQYGTRVVASSGDHYEYDDDIRRGRFDIAVFTYEKLAMLLVGSPDIASTCGLFVVDEVQMISDRNRGPGLELLITKFLYLATQAQILALSASIDNFDGLDLWLGAVGLLVHERPIELREGIYSPDGTFKYREWNTKAEGEEHFPPVPSGDTEIMLEALVAHLVAAGEQILVFRKDRRATSDTARRLSEHLRLPPVTSVIESLQAGEETSARELLLDSLRKGVAFHNADLLSDERLLIELAFRRGDIRVICSTSTLAMGVNLPSRTVIIPDATKWERDERTGRFVEVPLSVPEYRNMSGRAGRYRYRDEFGRSMLIASSPLEHDQYRANLVGGSLHTVQSAMAGRPIAELVLDIVASGLGAHSSQVSAFMMRSFAGQRMWTTTQTRETVTQMISGALAQAHELGLVTTGPDGRLEATDLGKICARRKISLDTFVLLQGWLTSSLPVNHIAAAYFAARAPELSRISVPFSTSEYQLDIYPRQLAATASLLEVPPEILEDLTPPQGRRLPYEDARRVKMLLVSHAFTAGTPFRQLERDYRIGAGPIRTLCEHLAWITDAASALAAPLGRSDLEASTLSKVAETMRLGLPAPILPIARLRPVGLNRTHMMRLLEHDLTTPDAILDTEVAAFQGVISRRAAVSLQLAVQEAIADTLERRKHDQELRLNRIGADTAVLNALYEKVGEALEISLCDLFTPPFCHCVFERIAKQRDADPDNLLHLPGGGIIAFSVTARERQYVSMKKASEIIAGSAKHNPVARVVIGRPDFHVLAKRNAEEVVADGINYKLLPLPLLAEMYTRVIEGSTSHEQVLSLLRDATGYISSESLDSFTVKSSSGAASNSGDQDGAPLPSGGGAASARE